MTAIGEAMNRLFDLLCAPCGGRAEVVVAALSVLLGAVMLLIFRAATNQAKLVEARRVVTGRILELGLFQDHLGVLARIQKDLAVANLRYLGRSGPALLAMALPLVLVMAQIEARTAHRPLRAGEKTLVSVHVDPQQPGALDQVALTAPAGVTVEAGPVRDRAAGVATWRVRVDAPGDYELAVTAGGGQAVTKRVPADGGAPRLAAVRERPSLGRTLLNPAEAPLPPGQPVRAIAVDLPARSLRYGPVSLDWLVAVAVFSLLAGVVLKGPLRVRF
ncbi:MAG TPA: hypothetical protein PLQ13_05200 [Candidatus Krumholzibacteria bacterium]|nr:hypothetical protein [Candidatus Krumholzibacteria bacterium]